MRLLLTLFFVTGFAKAKPEHWNQFRGPNGDGDAGNANLPVEFSEKKNRDFFDFTGFTHKAIRNQ